jgi:hypothetical protein
MGGCEFVGPALAGRTLSRLKPVLRNDAVIQQQTDQAIARRPLLRCTSKLSNAVSASAITTAP